MDVLLRLYETKCSMSSVIRCPLIYLEKTCQVSYLEKKTEILFFRSFNIYIKPEKSSETM